MRGVVEKLESNIDIIFATDEWGILISDFYQIIPR